jgi:hypothetical protein
MKLKQQLMLTVASVFALASCAAISPAPAPMELCAVTEKTEALDPAQLRMALTRAQAYSNDLYGRDCFVCAELLRYEEGSIELHITSPVSDMLLNTSAVISVRAADGKVLSKGAYHSCHARYTSR